MSTENSTDDDYAEDKNRRTEAEYRAIARKRYAVDGVLEFDEDAKVSISDDGGAYVQCWRWVDDEDL